MEEVEQNCKDSLLTAFFPLFGALWNLNLGFVLIDFAQTFFPLPGNLKKKSVSFYTCHFV